MFNKYLIGQWVTHDKHKPFNKQDHRHLCNEEIDHIYCDQ
jgi:hypothetical protein